MSCRSTLIKNHARAFVALCLCLVITGCIPGRYNLKFFQKAKESKISEVDKTIASSSNPKKPKFKLSGLPAQVRKNDCYPAVVSIDQSAGDEVQASFPLLVQITASAGVVTYSSLEACQTYNQAFEERNFFLSSKTSEVSFYFRSDTSNPMSLSVNAPNDPTSSLESAVAAPPVIAQSFVAGSGFSERIFKTLPDEANNRIYYVGWFDSVNDVAAQSLARTTLDGKVDPSFVQTGTGLDSGVSAISLQADGKILVGGGFSNYNGTSRSCIARLNIDGSLDTSFSLTGTGLNNSVSQIQIQTDGKILVGGNFISYNGTAMRYVARLHSDGSLDTSFTQTGSGLSSWVRDIAIQSDGKILIGGNFTSYDGTTRKHIARLNADGSLDTTFTQTGSGLANAVQALQIQSDGKIVLGGDFDSYNGTARYTVARLNSNGSLDTSFNQTGSGLGNNGVKALKIDYSGKIVVGGAFISYDGTARQGVARLNANGSLDTSFSQTGSGLNLDVLALNLQNDGKILVGGNFLSYNGVPRRRAARLNVDGSLDDGFLNNASGFDSFVNSISSQSDSKFIVGGDFQYFDRTSTPRVARITKDGTLDSSFAQTGSGLNGTVKATQILSNRKILVGGGFTSYDGTSRSYIARLNENGSLDTSFSQTGSGLASDVDTIEIQTDGKILVGGSYFFTSYNGTSRPYIARLNSDGSLDTSFSQTGSGFNNPVKSIALQSDGKIIVGGEFTSYNGTSRRRIARLNQNGSLDTSFTQTGSGLNSWVYDIEIQNDGKVVVGGYFDSYNGTAAPRLARLNANGSLDTSFAQQGTGLNDTVRTLKIQSDGKILVGGDFYEYDGSTSWRYLARFHADGSLDTSLKQTGSSYSSGVFTIHTTGDYKILVGGWFTSYNDATVDYFARLTYIGGLD